jgi:hypothetical protein
MLPVKTRFGEGVAIAVASAAVIVWEAGIAAAKIATTASTPR